MPLRSEACSITSRVIWHFLYPKLITICDTREKGIPKIKMKETPMGGDHEM